MRTCMLAIAAALVATTANLQAGDGCAARSPSCAAAPSCGCGEIDPGCGCGRRGRGCGECGAGDCFGCGLHGEKCGCPIDGLSRFSNCGCNGSYNYPVPPLYTYHWPGMYKQVRMTDYHSPWRFPPLKRYEDEPLPTIEIPAPKAAANTRLLRPVSLGTSSESATPVARTWSTDIEPLSSRLSR